MRFVLVGVTTLPPRDTLACHGPSYRTGNGFETADQRARRRTFGTANVSSYMTSPGMSGPKGSSRSGSKPRVDARRATIIDVAREAGVSVSAVSKVLRNAYGVSPGMQVKVASAIEKLGYRPHAAARAMRGKSYTIGVMLVDLSSLFQTEIVSGIGDELERTPFQEILVVPGRSTLRQQRGVEALIDRRVDGLILIAPSMTATWLEGLALTVPTLVVARHGGAANYDTVVDDDYEGARLMVDYLVNSGHKQISYTTHPVRGLKRPFVLPQTARCDGYVRTMREHGLHPDVITTTLGEQGGYAAALRALERAAAPTAIFADHDMAALGVLRAAEEKGVRVPEELTVAGYDNIFTSTIGRVSLTTVDQAGHLTGSMSATLLLERIDGRIWPVHSVITPRLIVRSTSTFPAENRPQLDNYTKETQYNRTEVRARRRTSGLA